EAKRSADAEGSILSDFLFVPSVIMRWLFPVIVVLALFLFLRGHDQPGGGFIAGITMSIAFILQYLAGGTRWPEERLRILPVYWIGIGLLLALLTGAGSGAFGYPFLPSACQYADRPVRGRVAMATALLFGLGGLALGVGATVLVLLAIAHQATRGAKPTNVRPPVAEPPASKMGANGGKRSWPAAAAWSPARASGCCC